MKSSYQPDSRNDNKFINISQVQMDSELCLDFPTIIMKPGSFKVGHFSGFNIDHHIGQFALNRLVIANGRERKEKG